MNDIQKGLLVLHQQALDNLNYAARKIQGAANKASVPLEDFSAELQERMQELAKVNFDLSIDDAQLILNALSSSIATLKPNAKDYVDSFDRLLKLRDELRGNINDTLEYIRRTCNK